MIIKLRGIIVELAHAVAKRERCAQRHKAESEDLVRCHNEERERLHAQVAVLEAELVACGRQPLKPILVPPSTLGYQL